MSRHLKHQQVGFTDTDLALNQVLWGVFQVETRAGTMASDPQCGTLSRWPRKLVQLAGAVVISSGYDGTREPQRHFRRM